MSREWDRAIAELDSATARVEIAVAEHIRGRGDRRRRRQVVGSGLIVLAIVGATAWGVDRATLREDHRPSVAATQPSHLPDAYPDPYVLDLEGIGPYRIGAREADLRAAGLLADRPSPQPCMANDQSCASPAEVSPPWPECPNVTSYQGTGRYAGKLVLTIKDGRLVEIATGSDDSSIRSLKGAMVGMSYSEVQLKYGDRGHMQTSKDGKNALIVEADDRIILFSGNKAKPDITYFAVGLTDYTLYAFLNLNSRGPC